MEDVLELPYWLWKTRVNQGSVQKRWQPIPFPSLQMFFHLFPGYMVLCLAEALSRGFPSPWAMGEVHWPSCRTQMVTAPLYQLGQAWVLLLFVPPLFSHSSPHTITGSHLSLYPPPSLLHPGLASEAHSSHCTLLANYSIVLEGGF